MTPIHQPKRNLLVAGGEPLAAGARRLPGQQFLNPARSFFGHPSPVPRSWGVPAAPVSVPRLASDVHPAWA
jgi:hypothetical protein